MDCQGATGEKGAGISQAEVQHFVTFIHPGVVFGDHYTQEIDHRDPSRVELPKGAIGFRFHDKTKTVIGGETLHGAGKNCSGWFYVGATRMTLEDVKREMPNEEILISNMRINDIKAIARWEFGTSYPLRENDVILEPLSTTGTAPLANESSQTEGGK